MSPHRRAGLALGLIALSTTAGCAHFRDAHERALRDQGQSAPEAPPSAPAQVAPRAPVPPPAAPSPAPQPTPSPAPQATPVAEAAPSPSPKAQRAAQKAQQAQDAADARAARRQGKAEAKRSQAAPSAPVRQPVFETPAPAPQPATPPAPAYTAPVAAAPVEADPATPGAAIVIFANVPGTRCGACETTKISVTPSGKVLIERGHGAEESWRYRRSTAHVTPARAAAFAARLAAMRPVGKQAMACPAPAQGDGVNVEWIEAGRHDQLTLAPGCGNAALAGLLRAPDLLGLGLTFPWDAR